MQSMVPTVKASQSLMETHGKPHKMDMLLKTHHQKNTLGKAHFVAAVVFPHWNGPIVITNNSSRRDT